jgi:hypothetical protein
VCGVLRAWRRFDSGRSSYFGETIYDGGVAQAWSTAAALSAPRVDTTAVTYDKVPLIVPPTAGKSGFFQNEIIRGQWRLARDALSKADRIYCVGYSLPVTDSLLRFLLADATAGKDVYPVNRTEHAPDHYSALLSAARVHNDHISPRGVSDFVGQYAGEGWAGPEVSIITV